MKAKTVRSFTIPCTCLLFLVASAAAQEEAAETKWNEFRINEEVSLSLNGYMYIYHIRNHNAYHLDRDAAWTEITMALGFDLRLTDAFSSRVRLVGTGLYGRPENYLFIEPADMETFFDLANITWHTALEGHDLHVTAGLQELMYGDGFLIMDGFSEKRAVWTTPVRSFPALRAALDLGSENTLDLFAAHVRNDFVSYEAVLGTGVGTTTGGSLTGGNLHLAGTAAGTWDFGVFYKDEDDSTRDAGGVVDPRGPGSDTLALSVRDTLSLGAEDRWTLTAEVVRQYGETRVYNDVINPDQRDRRAWGGHLTARWRILDEGLKPYLQARYVHFGGDRRSTRSVEGFDPFFFGWNDWGQWWLGDMTSFIVPHNNARIYQLETGMELTEKSRLRLLYFNTALLEELHDGSPAAAGRVDTKPWSHEFNVVYDYTFNDYVFTGVMCGANIPRSAAESWWGDDKVNWEAIFWIGFMF